MSLSNTAEALLAAVRTDPASDLPRLVYADWLDDYGEHDRAEYIRLQIAEATAPGLCGCCRVPDACCPRCRRREALVRRLSELANRPGGVWSLPAGVDGACRRGFVAELRLTQTLFFEHARHLFAQPVEAVTLTGCRPRVVVSARTGAHTGYRWERGRAWFAAPPCRLRAELFDRLPGWAQRPHPDPSALTAALNAVALAHGRRLALCPPVGSPA